MPHKNVNSLSDTPTHKWDNNEDSHLVNTYFMPGSYRNCYLDSQIIFLFIDMEDQMQKLEGECQYYSDSKPMCVLFPL